MNQIIKVQNQIIPGGESFLSLRLFMRGVPWSIQIFSRDIVVAVLEPLEGIPRVVVVDHALNVSGIVVEISKSPTYIIGLDVVQVDVVPSASRKQSEELSDVF